jgi:hypothetical protein
MVVVGFEDSSGGQRRVIVNDLVGGLALRDEAEQAGGGSGGKWSWVDGPDGKRQTRIVSASVSGGSAGTAVVNQFPPDGGVGVRVLALWSYYPGEGEEDELMFPKGSEVREVQDINGDWYWGVYAGSKGVFPGNHVRVLEGHSK